MLGPFDIVPGDASVSLRRAVLLLAPLLVASQCFEPAVDPSQPLCYGEPVWLGYKCCNDGYPGQCQEEETCYPPDECRGPLPDVDEPMMARVVVRKRK